MKIYDQELTIMLGNKAYSVTKMQRRLPYSSITVCCLPNHSILVIAASNSGRQEHAKHVSRFIIIVSKRIAELVLWTIVASACRHTTRRVADSDRVKAKFRKDCREARQLLKNHGHLI